MTTFSESLVFEPLFRSVFEYEDQTGIHLVRHPLAVQFERCISVESVIEVLQEQARAFREFRREDNETITLLEQVVQILHTLSTTVVHGEDICLVCQKLYTLHSMCLMVLLQRVPLVRMIYTSIGTLLAVCISAGHMVRVVVTFRYIGYQRHQYEL